MGDKMEATELGPFFCNYFFMKDTLCGMQFDKYVSIMDTFEKFIC